MERLLPRVGAALAAALIGVGGAAPGASAQLPVAVPAEVQQVLDQARAGSAQAEEQARTSVGGSLAAAGVTPPPGLVPSQARSPQPAPPPPPDPTPQSPCPRTAAACVDLEGNRTWLQSGERLSYGPVRMSHGKPGWETPTGTYQVTRKVRHEVSRLFDDAPMPYSVYFVGGIAFHEGDPAFDSHGCIRLDQPAAATYFDRLQVGDTVVVF